MKLTINAAQRYAVTADILDDLKRYPTAHQYAAAAIRGRLKYCWNWLKIECRGDAARAVERAGFAETSFGHAGPGGGYSCKIIEDGVVQEEAAEAIILIMAEIPEYAGFGEYDTEIEADLITGTCTIRLGQDKDGHGRNSV